MVIVPAAKELGIGGMSSEGILWRQTEAPAAARKAAEGPYSSTGFEIIEGSP